MPVPRSPLPPLSELTGSIPVAGSNQHNSRLKNKALELPRTGPLQVVKAPPVNQLNHSHMSHKGEYIPISNLTSNQVLENDYLTTYKRYETAVRQTREWLHNKITEQGLITQLGEARKSRSTSLFRQMHETIYNLLTTYFSKQKLSKPDVDMIIALAMNETLGMGPIEPLWVDPNISEIMVNSPHQIYVEISGKVYKVPGVRFRNRNHLLEMIQQMLTPLNKTLDQARPLEDGRLPDGSRFNATHWVITPGGPSLTIRRFSDDLFTIRRFVEIGSMPGIIAEELANLTRYGSSVVLSGATASGKTSLLNALAGIIPIDERIITIEDTLEIRLHPSRHVLSHEARESRDNDGRTEVSIRDLVKNSLRERPDRLIIGEIRDEAALDFVNALSTGHDGSMGTIHANNSVATITRLASLIMQAGEMDYTQALATMGFAIDIIVNTRRFSDGSRRIAEVAEVPQHISIKEDTPILAPRIIWKFIEKGTDANGNIIGEYHKINEWSDELLELKNIHAKKWLSLQEIYALSDNL